MTARWKVLLVVAALAVSTGALAGCSGDDEGRVHASATFDDVADLADGAPVMMADITIGNVTAIRLAPDGRRAEVEFAVDRSADVPADVVAQIRRTSALGEKFVDLAPKGDDPKTPALADGTVLQETKVVSDLEQLVSSGTAAFEALSASQLAILIDEGARAVGGKGEALSQVIDNLATVVDGYERHTEDVVGIIDDLNVLSGDLAPAVEPNGAALANLNDTLDILNSNDADFYDLVDSLNDVATEGSQVLADHLTQIRTQVVGLRDVVGAVATEQDSLGKVLEYLPDHNTDLPLAEQGNFIQVLLDVVVCGVPGSGDVPGDPVDACYPGAES